MASRAFLTQIGTYCNAKRTSRAVTVFHSQSWIFSALADTEGPVSGTALGDGRFRS